MNFMEAIGNFIRSAIIPVFVFITVAVAFGNVYAAPANDNFAAAQLLSGSGNVQGSNVGATKEANEPDHGKNSGGASVWYKFVAPGNGVLELLTNGGIDSLLGVYTGSINGTLLQFAQGDDFATYSSGGVFARANVGVKTGVTYYIAVDGKNKFDGNGPDTGNFGLYFTFKSAASNDDFANAASLSYAPGTYTWTSSNIGATKEPGEPNHLGNAGGRSVWFKYDHSNVGHARQISFTISSVGGSYSQTGVVTTLVGVYIGPSVSTLVPIFQSGGNSNYTNQRFSFLAQPGMTYYIAVDGYNPGTGADTGTFTLTYGVTKETRNADFDKDGKADVTVFRPSTGAWYSLDSGTQKLRALQWGTNGDVPLLQKQLADDTLYAAFRPSNGIWYRTADAALASQVSFGTSGDIPLMRNYRQSSGTVSTNLAVFRPSTGTWWIRNALGGYPVQFGLPGDIPLSADFDGDGNDELTIFRPSNGTWYLYNQIENEYQVVQFGSNGDRPVPADYDEDGIADIAVFRPSNGTWYVLTSVGSQVIIKTFGQPGDIPQPADYDGDGRTDYAVFRNGVWWINLHSYSIVKAVQWGLPGDIPVASPFR